ncbi:DNA polymerase III subunit beta [Agrobacterium sp. AGB01]|uniref:DNA polymerase III subunit beta n=1 Tax=Agrobacterium sp. AGB01 TaxID=2769302 RepID=UPI001784B9A4|nr:DNA polymerase III subunit beta [Agrobacterium sp. AGB01]MBD9390168.1 DNA polymerase III subunit beta [Agrobacterium sp. AGB01]
MLTTKKSDLSSALGLVGTIVEKRNTIPILSNVAIERVDGGLRARMTDLDLEAEITFSAALGQDFRSFTAPGHLLREIVSKLPDGADITIEAKDDKQSPDSVTVKSGRSRFALQSLPTSDLSSMNLGALPFTFTVSTKLLLAAIGAVGFAISTEETRYYLNGIFMHPGADGMLFVATDGHRLAKRFIAVENAPADAPGVIIPRKTVLALSKILPKDGEVTIEWNDTKICFILPGTRLISKLIDGQFPDYVRVIPKNNGKQITVRGKDLSAAVERVQLISTERGRAMRFAFTADALTLTINNPDAGSAEEQIACEGDQVVEIGFNSRYVLDAISHLAEDDIQISLDDPVAPAVLRVDGDHAENLIVLMPVRV